MRENQGGGRAKVKKITDPNHLSSVNHQFIRVLSIPKGSLIRLDKAPTLTVVDCQILDPMP